MQRRDSGYFGRRLLEMELPGRQRGRPKRIFMDAVRENMQVGTRKHIWVEKPTT